MKIHQHNGGHMTKMASMPIYGNFYAPNFEKVGGHIGFGLSVCMYVRMYVCIHV